MSENFIIGNHWSKNQCWSSRPDDSPLSQNSSNRLNSLARIKLWRSSLSPSVLLCFLQARFSRGPSWASAQGEEEPVASWKVSGSVLIGPACISCMWAVNPTECRPPGSSVHGISQARILEWVAISSPGDLPNPGIKPASPVSPALSGRFFTTEPQVPTPTKHCSQENRMRVCGQAWVTLRAGSSRKMCVFCYSKTGESTQQIPTTTSSASPALKSCLQLGQSAVKKRRDYHRSLGYCIPHGWTSTCCRRP